MATDDSDFSDAASRQESIVGSETGFPMAAAARYRDEPESTEETTLLGAGAHDDDGGDDPIPSKRDVWTDDPDFAHLPPWRRPSVCRRNHHIVALHNQQPTICKMPCSQDAISRSGGY